MPRKILIAALAALTGMAGVSSSYAGPLNIGSIPQIESNIVKVQDARDWLRGAGPRGGEALDGGRREHSDGGSWGGWRERDRRDWSDWSDRRDWRRDRYGSWRGYRGYRDYRRGYRRHSDGWWYPLAAFGAGAVIGGAITSPRTYSGSSAHVQWCSERYRTYRAYDNTYVPRAGVRAQCNSPYN